MRKNVTFLIFFLLLFFLFPLNTFGAGYTWVTSDTIKASDGRMYYSTLSEKGKVGTNVNFQKFQNIYAFASEATVRYYENAANGTSGLFTPDYIGVDRVNPLTGYPISSTYALGTKFSIADPNKVAPTPQKSLGTGNTINGKISFITRDGSGTPVAKKLIVGEDGNGGELDVFLFDENGIQLGDVKKAIYDSATKQYTWNQNTVPQEMFTNKKYTLKTDVPDDKYVNCFTGGGRLKCSQSDYRHL